MARFGSGMGLRQTIGASGYAYKRFPRGPGSGPAKLIASRLDRVARLLRDFSDPGRLAIVQELKVGEKSVSEIVDAMSTSQTNAPEQLKLLHETGVLARRKQGTGVRYRIADPAVAKLCKLVCDKLNRDTTSPGKIGF